MKIILFTYFSYALSLLQFSFLPAVAPFFPFPNLLMIFSLFYAILEDPNDDGAFYLAIICGALNDLMSPHYFGFYIIIFFVTVYFTKLILKRYVQPSAIWRI